MPIMGCDRYYPPWVTVLAGTGMVWENLTCSIPVRYPSSDEGIAMRVVVGGTLC